MALKHAMAMKSNHRGQALVEAALSIVVILLVVMGIIEFGRLMFVYNEMTNAARNGARWASVQNPTTMTAANIRTDLLNGLPSSQSPVAGISAGDFNVQVAICTDPSTSTCTWPVVTSGTACTATSGPSSTIAAGATDKPLIWVRTCGNLNLFLPGFFYYLGTGGSTTTRTINGIAVFQYEQ